MQFFLLTMTNLLPVVHLEEFLMNYPEAEPRGII